jgi:hypothetical protein
MTTSGDVGVVNERNTLIAKDRNRTVDPDLTLTGTHVTRCGLHLIASDRCDD